MIKAKWIKCNGEAHQPSVAGQIDHCGICMPYWGEYPVCLVDLSGLTEKGFCKKCREYYEVE